MAELRGGFTEGRPYRMHMDALDAESEDGPNHDVEKNNSVFDQGVVRFPSMPGQSLALSQNVSIWVIGLWDTLPLKSGSEY
ncbi:hypothetical protein N7463_000601 [Penicillium fimorum]|uniref:Uncharacterized protein n=1 Tax=Penicillium fimorum TaxID=1882269 RepID=A0A9W9Y677_9EURO|nr:hypothetical protein N7463_000601 [Penicillium fimorum]